MITLQAEQLTSSSEVCFATIIDGGYCLGPILIVRNRFNSLPVKFVLSLTALPKDFWIIQSYTSAGKHHCDISNISIIRCPL